MTTHDSDSRYSDTEARARVAVLYLPLLGIVMDTIPQLHTYLQEAHDNLNHIGFLEDYQGPQSSKFLRIMALSLSLHELSCNFSLKNNVFY